MTLYFLMLIVVAFATSETCSEPKIPAMEQTFIAVKPDAVQVKIHCRNKSLFKDLSLFSEGLSRKNNFPLWAKRISNGWDENADAFTYPARTTLSRVGRAAVFWRVGQLYELWSRGRHGVERTEHYSAIPCHDRSNKSGCGESWHYKSRFRHSGQKQYRFFSASLFEYKQDKSEPSNAFLGWTKSNPWFGLCAICEKRNFALVFYQWADQLESCLVTLDKRRQLKKDMLKFCTFQKILIKLFFSYVLKRSSTRINSHHIADTGSSISMAFYLFRWMTKSPFLQRAANFFSSQPRGLKCLGFLVLAFLLLYFYDSSHLPAVPPASIKRLEK